MPDQDDNTAKPRQRHPLLGCLKGSVIIPAETDVTKPADPSWGESLDDPSVPFGA